MKTCKRQHTWGPPHTRCPECKKLKDNRYHTKNKEELKTYKKQWYKTNKEEHNEKSKKYYQDNRDKILAQTSAYQKRNKDKIRAQKYGLTVEQVAQMLKNQDHKCAICSATLQKYHIDHCHTTNKVRGILCISCNVRLGWFEGREEAITKYRSP